MQPQNFRTKFMQIVEKAFNKKPDLKNITAMPLVADYFGNPQKDYKIVHVAGTNGKGSTCVKIATLLEKSGLKTGLFVSPHISTVRERFQINRQKISQEDFVKYYEQVEQCETELGLNLSFFQSMLAMSVIYFKDFGCDYVVLECGIGGWHSQTNFWDSDYAVITSIGLDHCNVLGNTEKEILLDKAGIIRDNIPVIVGPQVDLEVLQPIIDKHNANLIQIPKEIGKWFTDYNKSISLAVYQQILANEKLRITEISDEDIEIWLSKNPPCRLEPVLPSLIEALHPSLTIYPSFVYLDVGHNPPALTNLLTALSPKLKTHDLYIISSFSSNKDILSSLSILSEKAIKIRLVLIKHPRLIKKQEAIEIVEKIQKVKEDVKEQDLDQEEDKNLESEEKGEVVFEFEGSLAENFKATLEEIDKKGSENSIILVWGSVFIMEGVRDLLGIKQEKDFE